MKINKTNDLGNRLVASVFLLIFLPTLLPAQSVFSGKKEGKIRLDQYMDRASIERSEEKWQQTARNGLIAAMEVWENRNVLLKESDYEQWKNERSQTNAEYELAVASSYAEWQTARYYEESAAVERSDFVKNLSEEFRKKRAEVLETTSLNSKTSEQISQVRKEWESYAAAEIEDAVDAWEKRNCNSSIEISKRINETLLNDEEKQKIVDSYKETYKNYLAKEFESVMEAEINGVVSDLLKVDVQEKEKLYQTEAYVTGKTLAEETEATTTASMNKLLSELDTDISAADDQEIKLAQQDWLQKFYQEMNVSLSKWDKAENDFLEARTKWEQAAYERSIADEKVWQSAYDELEQRRQKWNKELSERIQQVQDEWNKQIDDTKNELSVAFDDYAKILSAENMRTEQIAQIQIDIYSQSREVLQVAEEGIDTWFGRWTDKYEGVYSYWKTENLADKNKTLADRLSKAGKIGTKTYVKTDEDINTIKEQISIWKRMYIEMLANEVGKINTAYDKELIKYPSIANLNYSIKSKEIYERKKSCGTLASKIMQSNENTIDDASIKAFISEINQRNAELGMTPSKEVVAIFTHTDNLFTNSKELGEWFSIVSSYSGKAKSAVRNLFALTNASLQQDDSDYDDIDAEYQKTEQLVAYWSEQKQVNDALLEFAKNVQMSNETVEKQKEIISTVSMEYQTMLAKYRVEAEKLTDLQGTVNELSVEMETNKADLQRAKEKVDNAQTALKKILITQNNADPEQICKSIHEIYTEIQNIIDDSEIRKNDVLKKIYENSAEAQNILISQQKNQVIKDIQTRKEEVESYLQQLTSQSDAAAIERKMMYARQIQIYEAALEYMTEGQFDESKYADKTIVDAVHNQYDQYSSDYINKVSNDSCRQIAELMKNTDVAGLSMVDGSLSAYIQSLMKKAKGLADNASIVLEDYISELIREKACEGTSKCENTEGVYNEQSSVYEEYQYYKSSIYKKEGLMDMCSRFDGNEDAAVKDAVYNTMAYLYIDDKQLTRDSILNSDDLSDGVAAWSGGELNEAQCASLVQVLMYIAASAQNGQILEDEAAFIMNTDIIINKIEKVISEAEYKINDALYKIAYNTFFDEREKYAINDSDKIMNEVNEAVKNQLTEKEKQKYVPLEINTDVGLDYGFASDFAAFFEDGKYMEYEIKGPANQDKTYSSFITETTSAEDSLLQFRERQKTAIESIKSNLFVLDLYAKANAGLNSAVLDAKEKLAGAESEYEDNYSAYTKSVSQFKESCALYDEQYDRVSEAYAGTEKKRVERRCAEEEYEYLTNAYLHSEEDNEPYAELQERCSSAQKSYDAAEMSLQVLDEYIKSGAAQTEKTSSMSRYEELVVNSYKMEALQSEINGVVENKKSALYKTQQNKNNTGNSFILRHSAEEKIVADGAVSSFVTVTGDEKSGYKIVLSRRAVEGETIEGETVEGEMSFKDVVYGKSATLTARVEGDSIDAITDYFNDTVEEIDAYGTKTEYRASEEDAAQWITSLVTTKQDKNYLNKVVLAAMYLESLGTDEEKEEWKFDYQLKDESLGSIPSEEIHGINPIEKYRSYCKKEMKSAYEYIESTNGTDDIAKYFLYRNTVINNNVYDIEQLGKKYMEVEAAKKTVRDIQKDVDSKTEIVVNSHIAATLLMFSIFIPISARVAGVIVLEALAFDLSRKAEDLNDLKNSVSSVSSGMGEIYEEKNNSFIATVKNYDALCVLEQQQKNELKKLAGDDNENKEEITYEIFQSLLQKNLGNNGAVSFDQLTSVSDGNRSGGQNSSANLKELFERLTTKRKNEMGIGYTDVKTICSDLYHSVVESKNSLEKIVNSENTQNAGLHRAYVAAYESKLSSFIDGTQEASKSELEELARAAWKDNPWSEHKLISYCSNLYNQINNLQLVRYDRSQEEYCTEVQAAIISLLDQALQSNMQLKLNVKMNEGQSVLNKIQLQKEQWLGTLAKIRVNGISEWASAKKKLDGSHEKWTKEFKQAYDDKAKEWKKNYTSFIEKKQQWMTEQYMYAQNVANVGTLSQSGLNVDDVINRTIDAMVKSDAYTDSTNELSGRVSEYVDSLYDADAFAAMLDFASSAVNQAKLSGAAVVQGMKMNMKTVALLDDAIKTQDDIENEMKYRSAQLVAEQAAMSLSQTVDAYMNRLDKENESMLQWEKDMLRSDGYSTGSEFSRVSVVESTLMKNFKEKQTVHVYQSFETMAPVADVNFNNSMSESQIMELLFTSQKKIAEWGAGIFGKQNTNGTNEYEIKRSMIKPGAKYEEAEPDEQIKRFEVLKEKLKDTGWENLSEGEKNEYSSLSQQIVSIRDGALGDWIGYTPVFKQGQDLDLEEDKFNNILYEGAGEIGKIMLDYEWNSIVAQKGYAELALPLYDRKMWSEKDAFIEPPSLRNLTSMVMDIVGICTSQTWLSYADDLLFGALDIAGGYKDPMDVLTGFGKQLLVQGISSGIGKIGNWAGSALSGLTSGMTGFGESMFNFSMQAGICATTNYVSSVASSYVNAISWDGSRFSMDWDAANSSWTDSHVLAGALGAGVTGGLGAGIDKKLHSMGAQGAAISKFYGGAINLGVSAAGKAAEYGTYLAYAGGDFGRAYDDMGGLTLNVANLGAILDMAGSIDARTNATGQSELGKIAQSLGGAGFLEVTIGSNGLSSRFGTGGIDLGGNLYQLGKRLNDKAALEAYAARHGNREAATIYNDYVYGDWTQENTAARLAGGIDSLEFVEGTDYTAKTTDNGRGGRIIRMKDTGNDLNNAVQLGHEAYRDGIVDSGNADETINAVIAHTAMAENMESWGADVSLKGLLGLETAAYKSGNKELLEAIAENCYDSSADYWLFKSDGRIVDDGTYYFSREIVNEKGEIVSEKITDFMFSGSRVAALVKAIGFDNVKKMLGEKSQIRFTNTDLYDEVTLKEVGLSEKEIWLARKTGSLDSVNLSDDQKAKLLGEAYMQASGSSFNNETKLWEGGNTFIPGLEKNDSLGVIRDNNGKYQFFASGMTFTRQDDAFDAWKDGVDSKSYDVKDNTDVTIWKRDLFTGETISETLEGAWTSVSHHSNDNGTAINVDGHTYKQNTIISEYFKMHLIDYGNSDRYGVSTVGVITDATTLGGQTVDKYGKIANQTNDWGRWLIHSMAGNGGSAGCFGPMSDENVVIPTNYQGAIWNNASLSGSGASYMQKLINTLKNEWGIYNGYEFNMHLQGRVKP